MSYLAFAESCLPTDPKAGILNHLRGWLEPVTSIGNHVALMDSLGPKQATIKGVLLHIFRV